MAEGMKNELPGALFPDVAESPLTGNQLISCCKGSSPNSCFPHNWGQQGCSHSPYWERSWKGDFLWSAFCNTWISFHTPRREINWLYSHFAPDQNNTINQQCFVRAGDVNCGAWFRCFSVAFDTMCKENACLKMHLQSQPVHCPWEANTSHITLLCLTVLWF